MVVALLRLDHLSRENVLKFLDPFELFLLSFCSKTSYRIVQNALRRASSFYSLDLHLEYNYSIGIQFETDTNWMYWSCRVRPLCEALPNSWELTKIQGNLFLRHIGTTDLETYWEDPVQGIKILMKHITGLYNKPIEILYMKKASPKKSVEILKFVNSHQGSIKYGHVNLDNVELEKDRSEVMEQLKSVEDLEANWVA